METALFYIMAAVAVAATGFCITERHPVHAVIYLVTSFFSLAVIFYLLGAPLVAVFEVIIYAGAIMVLFLFIIMMLRIKGHQGELPTLREWLPALLMAGVVAAGAAALLVRQQPQALAAVSVKDFSRALFQRYGAAVELISLQLLFALVGALYLGRREK
ncbi:MAG TPA: NADH-quinone oxidoreductase subunit J [Verrucomicrobiae bacterium]|nr:NADH-quinone oxidoreductase subunit J [Verrucomicrobiae bacterium]